MQQIEPNLWQTTLYKQGMLSSHAYLLTREDGNILFYNTNNKSDLADIAELGGIKYQLLTHRDEVGNSLSTIKNQFNSSLAMSVLEKPFAEQYTEVDIVIGSSTQVLEDILIIATPGHTDGSICFFYESPFGKAYLFSGDSIFQWDNKWKTFVMESAGGSKNSMIQSLTKLKSVKPDLVLSSGFVGGNAYGVIEENEWDEILNQCIENI